VKILYNRSGELPAGFARQFLNCKETERRVEEIYNKRR
jgi:hypothetical protein